MIQLSVRGQKNSYSRSLSRLFIFILNTFLSSVLFNGDVRLGRRVVQSGRFVPINDRRDSWKSYRLAKRDFCERQDGARLISELCLWIARISNFKAYIKFDKQHLPERNCQYPRNSWTALAPSLARWVDYTMPLTARQFNESVGAIKQIDESIIPRTRENPAAGASRVEVTCLLSSLARPEGRAFLDTSSWIARDPRGTCIRDTKDEESGVKPCLISAAADPPRVNVWLGLRKSFIELTRLPTFPSSSRLLR